MASNNSAAALKALHQPSCPVVFANIWDVASLNALISLNDGESTPVKAVATASWAFAAALGIKDEELTLEQNMDAVSKIGPICQRAGLPLSVDLQDGYGAQIESAMSAALDAGAHGANIEDSIPSAGFGKGISGSLYGADDQVRRLKSAMRVAKDAGCPDFVLNARCDVFKLDPSPDLDESTRMKEALARGKAYLEAGATTVFYWGGARGLTTAQVETLVKELGGRVAVKMAEGPGALSTKELARLGVARISVGPSLFLVALNSVKKAALEILNGGTLPA